MKKVNLVIAFVLFVAALFAQAPRPFPVGLPTCLEDDFRELEKFYDATDGDHWFNNSGWLKDKDMSKWYGIYQLTSDSCDIDILFFPPNGNNMNGNLIDFKLPKLTELIIDQDRIKGSIIDFSGMPNLRHLQLITPLSGTIPDFSNLPNLNMLTLSSNEINGKIPNFSKLPNLKSLLIYDTKLSGGIPNFSNIPKLDELDISYNNNLSGGIPNFSNIPNLKKLNISNNKLQGNIPDFSNLPNLEVLEIGDSTLTPVIPNFDNLLKLKDLRIYSLQNTIIPNFSNLELEYLNISSCKIKEKLPNFSKSLNIQTIDISNNTMSNKEIPDFELPKLRKLSLEFNGLNTDLPNFDGCPMLDKLYLSYNNLTFGNLEKSKFIREKSNATNYFRQLTILPINYIGTTLIGDLAGSTIDKLTYQWYRNDTELVATIQGNNQFTAKKPGKYHYEISHKSFISSSGLLYLVLKSESIIMVSTLKGNIFQDANKNCTLENNEKGIPNTIIRFENVKDTVYTTTDSLGNYEVPLDTFNYVIALNINNLWQSCAIPNVKFSSWTETKTQDIPMQSAVDCPALSVNIGTQRLRRCFDNTYIVSYENKGTIPAQNAFVLVDFDKYLKVKSASIPFTKVANNTYRFEVGTVDLFSPKSFSVQVLVDCDSTVLGQTHCTTAHIYPDSLCSYPPNWDKSSIVINAKCDNAKVKFDIKNTGTAPTSQPLQYFVIEDQIIMLQSQPFNLNINEVKNVEIPATGKTYRLTAKQSANHPSGNLFASAAVEGCGSMPFSLGFVTQYADQDAEPWIDIDCHQNIGSYDPNSKEASPTGATAAHLIDQNTDLEYQINFQNYGTDTAFTVVLRDTLSNLLNYSTLTMGASSHPYTWRLENSGLLEVIFAKANLTTKAADEAKSQGFVRFRIGQKRDLPIGKKITNKADIYFDFNPPIRTNETFHTIGKNPLIIVATDETATFPKDFKVKIQPNPFHYYTTFVIENNVEEQFNLAIFDLQGKCIHQQPFNGNELYFEKALPQGLYIYRIKGNNGSSSSGRFVVL